MESQYKVGSISDIIAKSCGIKSGSKSAAYDPKLSQLFSSGTGAQPASTTTTGTNDKKRKSKSTMTLTPKLIKTYETFSSSKTKIQNSSPKPKEKPLKETSKLSHKEAAAFRLQKKNKSETKLAKSKTKSPSITKLIKPRKNKKKVKIPEKSESDDDDEHDKDEELAAIDSVSENEDLELDQDEDEAKAEALDSKNKKSISFKELNAPKEKDIEQESRTLFIGNVPKDTKKSKLKKLFAEFGSIESVRLRCAAPAKPTTLKKIALRKNEIHPDRNSVVAFVRFSTREEAEKAGQGLNGFELNEHHLTINLADTGKKERDNKKAVFIGNLHLKTSDDELWSLFQDCGKISGVRIIRDAATGLGKGFGYVNFEDSGSVENALKFDGSEIRGRQLRVSRAVKKLKSKSGKKKSQGQRQRHETLDFASKSPATKESFSGDYLSEIGKLKRKSNNKINRGDMKKARIAKQLVGNSSEQTFPRAKTKFIPRNKVGQKNRLNSENPKISKSKPFKGFKPRSDNKNKKFHSQSHQRGSKPKVGKRK